VVPFDDDDVCQIDTDMLPYVGDACVEQGVAIQLEGAAGPVGHLDTDDFDQDGLANIDDKCPRIRSGRLADNYAIWTCATEDDCEGAECTNGVCNHVDTDNDNVGDLCDTCPSDGNSKQVLDGGMQEDDKDEDFVGTICETNSGCYDNNDPRPLAFYDKVANGQCCVMLFDEDAEFLDPGYVMIDEDTTVVHRRRPGRADQARLPRGPGERHLPQAARLGRHDARRRHAAARLRRRRSAAHARQPRHQPRQRRAAQVRLPHAAVRPGLRRRRRQACDLCEYAFDPNNEFYKDENNKVWPNYGKFCKGQFDPEKEQTSCEDVMGDTDTDTDTDTGGDTAGSTG
jgi:hypothetical protein